MTEIHHIRKFFLKIVTATTDYHDAWYHEDHWAQIILDAIGIDVKGCLLNGSAVQKAHPLISGWQVGLFPLTSEGSVDLNCETRRESNHAILTFHISYKTGPNENGHIRGHCEWNAA